MKRNNITALSLGLAILLFNLALAGEVACAYVTVGSGWTNTASGSSGLGQPATVTWSVVPDGTTLPSNFIDADGSSGGVNTPSDLISVFDGIHHNGASPGGSDLTQRNWWGLMNSAFERWDAVSGITYNYESQDDGVSLNSFTGQLGVRGDHRIGGHSLDGQISPSILAFNHFPNNADMVIDTDEINRWTNSTNNYRLFRNVMMHEIGHGLGLTHVLPNNHTKLMQSFISTAFDGPQFDDILGAHRLYGDRNEEGTGNDSFNNATPLGSILAGQTVSIGTDANDTSVAPGDIDFVSIDDNSDVDFFRFTIQSPGAINIKLTPLGPTYDEGSTADNIEPFDSSAESNLTLTLYDTNGTSLLQFANNTGNGQSEEIDNYQLTTAGDYYARIGGLSNAAQFFQLDISVVPEPTTLLLLVVGSVGCALTCRRTTIC